MRTETPCHAAYSCSMMKKVALLALLLLFACSRNVAVVAPPQNTNDETAIEVAYVGMPTVVIHQFPSESSPQITTFRYTETVSILAQKGDWVRVRTILGNGWMKRAELINAAEVEQVLKNPVPRFLTPPQPIPDSRAHGEIAMNARVNTDGEVIDVTLLNNSTRNKALADANTTALKTARFYPMLQKGQRVVFTYEHHVYY